jgi:hypothetical protein
MECACFSSGFDDYATVLAEHRRKARTTHNCDECLGAIYPGQSYLEERYLFDIVVTTHKTCECCESIRKHLYCDFLYGSVWSDLREQLYHSIHHSVDDVPWSRIAKLTPAARAHILLIIEELWLDSDYEVVE